MENAFHSLGSSDINQVRRALTLTTALQLDLLKIEPIKDELGAIFRHDVTEDDRVGELLKMLFEVPKDQQRSVFAQFVSALRRDGQEHVADVFCPQRPEQMVRIMSDDHFRKLLENRKGICDFTDPLNGLLDKLLKVCVLDINDISRIARMSRRSAITEELISVIARKPDQAFRELIDALHKTGQGHVARLLEDDSSVPPMSHEHRRLLIGETAQLTEFMNPGNSLQDKLVKHDVLTLGEVCRIGAKKGVHSKSRELLQILARKPDCAFEKFQDALIQCGQKHVAFLLGKHVDEKPMTSAHRDILSTKIGKLCQFIDCESGLLDHLLGANILSRFDLMQFGGKMGSAEMARKLLSILLRKSDSAFGALISGLLKTNQPHVVYILKDKGDKKPMSTMRRRNLRVNRDMLMQKIDSDTSLIVDKLFAYSVLNEREKEKMSRIRVCAQVNGLLLDAIERKSNCAYDQFIQALKDTGQEHVAKKLKGQLISAQVEMCYRDAASVSSSDRESHDTELLNDVKALVYDRDESRGSLNDVCSRNRIEVHDVYKNSIHIVFRCFDNVALDNLRALYSDRTLDELFTKKLCPKFVGRVESLKLSITSAQFVECRTQLSQSEIMSDEHGRALHFTAKDVVGRITVTPDLLLNLPITHEQQQAVSKAGDETDKSRQVLLLLQIIARRPDSCFAEFVRVLTETGNAEAADIIVAAADAERMTTFFTKLPVELLEMLLMKAFNSCFSDCYKSKYVVHEAVSTAYVALAAVCSTWKQTINGWPQSSTRHWFRNKLKRQIRELCGRYFPTRIRGSEYAPFWTDSGIFGLTECDNELYVVCQRSRKITVFQLDSKTDQRSALMTTIDVLEMNQPTDIVACPETGQLYIAAWTADSRCVFRVSVDGDRIVKLKPSMKSETGDAATESIPYTLSIRSRRLVATSRDTDELLVYETDDLEPSKCIDLANGCYEMDGRTKKRHYPIRYPLHALETLSNTFVVSSRDRKPLITEIDSEGNVLRGYSEQGGGGHDPQHLGWPWYLFGDSAGGLFVVDYDKHRVALLDGALRLQRFLVDVGHSWLTEGPRRMCYVEKTGRVFVASWNSVQEFRVHEPRSTQTA